MSRSDRSAPIGRPRQSEWARLYALQLGITDAVVVVVAMLVAQFLWVGNSIRGWYVVIPETSELSEFQIPYVLITVSIALIWALWLSGAQTRSPRVVGIGTTEYVRVVNVSLTVFASIVVVAFLVKIDIARGYLLTAFGIGIVGLIFARWLWRRHLVSQRRAGLMSSRALVVGSADGARYIADQFNTRFPHAGYRIVGACYPRVDKQSSSDSRTPLYLGGIDDVAAAVDQHDIDVVIVSGGHGLGPSTIRELSWSLEGLDVDMAVSPALLDVVGPRIHTRSIAGLPLVHVDIPEYESGRSILKAAFDRTSAAVALLILSPLLVAIAIAIKLDSPGPIFFRQERIGRRGAPFEMLKFRSMRTDAEAMLETLHDKNDSDGGVLFKMKDDPRVTAVGRFLRRHSLDELPQFINVLKGDMSVVGPRPPLRREVEQYETHVQRRFLVRPGLTGPWQVSGRSDLSWEESVRLDLYYVENWSITTDLVYIWRTLRVMVDGRGAY